MAILVLTDLVVRMAGRRERKAAEAWGACVPADLAAAGLAVVVDSVAADSGVRGAGGSHESRHNKRLTGG